MNYNKYNDDYDNYDDDYDGADDDYYDDDDGGMRFYCPNGEFNEEKYEIYRRSKDGGYYCEDNDEWIQN